MTTGVSKEAKYIAPRAGGNLTLQSGLILTLITLVVFAFLLGLGFWQLDRADQKRATYMAFEKGQSDPAVGLDALTGTAGDRYRRLHVSGQYDESHQFLLDNMTLAGRAGYLVLTPLHPAGGGKTLLVNRGWVPASVYRQQLPDVTVAAGERTLTGRVDYLPRPGIELEAGADDVDGWPAVVHFPRLEELEKLLGRPLRREILLLETTAPDGYERNWQPPGPGPERHLGYAVQWFGLAASLLIIYTVLIIRTRRKR